MRQQQADRQLKMLFDAGWQLTKIRAIIPCLLGCAGGSIWLGFHLAQSYGLNPGDGGVLAPLYVRLAWAAGLFLLGIILAAGTWLSARCYVARIGLDEETEILHISTVRIFGTRTDKIAASRIISSRFHEGYTEGDDSSPTVHAPYRTVRLQGRRLPLVLDLQGKLIEPELLKRFFKANEQWGKTFGILLALSSLNLA